MVVVVVVVMPRRVPLHAQVLQHIADDLGASGADPALYSRCAEFFIQHGHFDKAVKMLIAASQYTRALEMCVEHDVAITEVRRRAG